MTWGEAVLITLQKVFAVSGSKIDVNDTTSPYIAAMPHVANEALSLLATCGKYIIKNVEVTAQTDNYRFKFADVAEDFYSIREDDIFLNGALCSDFTLVAGKEIILHKSGNWQIYYNAYHEKITSSTPEDFEFQLDTEATSLVPLYMASQLYKDENAEIATMYRNEFEAGREALLYRDVQKAGSAGFMSVSEWI